MDNLVPQADGTYALTFKNFQKVSDEEVRTLFEEYGDIVSIRKSSSLVPWVFVRYRSYDEAFKAFKGLQSCKRFDIQVATSGRKMMEKGSEEREKRGETRDNEAPKAGGSRNFMKNQSGDFDGGYQEGRKNKGQISYNRNISARSPKEADEMEGKKNNFKTAGQSRNYLKTSPKEVKDTDPEVRRGCMKKIPFSKSTNEDEDNWDNDEDEGVEGAANSLQRLSIHGNVKHWKGKGEDDDMDVKPMHGKTRQWKGMSDDDDMDSKPMRGNARHWKGKSEEEGDTDVKPMHGNTRHWKGKSEDGDMDAMPMHGNTRHWKGRSEDGDMDVKQLHGKVRHGKGMDEDGEQDVKPYDEGPPKLMRATGFYGALTLQHPYKSGLASRAVFNEVWMNHPLREEMELHEVVITNFDAIPSKKEIMSLCSHVTVLHVSIEVTPATMPFCRVLVPTEEDAEKLYELDGVLYDGSPLYVSSLGHILDELAG